MSKDEKDFQRRVEYVARKLTTNREKREQIERCFLDERLKKFWGGLSERIRKYEKHCFIHDMFDSYAKKLCFYDIHCFINRRLAKQDFKEQIEKFCSKQELDEDLNLSYTF